MPESEQTKTKHPFATWLAGIAAAAIGAGLALYAQYLVGIWTDPGPEAAIVASGLPISVRSGASADTTVSIENAGTRTVSNCVLTWTVDNRSSAVVTSADFAVAAHSQKQVHLAAAHISYGSAATVTTKFLLSCDAVGDDRSWSLKVTK